MGTAQLNIYWRQELKIDFTAGGSMIVEQMTEGVKKIRIGTGERLSVHGYSKGEKPSGENEIISFFAPLEIEIRVVKSWRNDAELFTELEKDVGRAK